VGTRSQGQSLDSNDHGARRMYGSNVCGSGSYTAASIGGPTLHCAYCCFPGVPTGFHSAGMLLIGVCELCAHTTSLWLSASDVGLGGSFSSEVEPNLVVSSEFNDPATIEKELAPW
jgi:hypothetical protein